MTRAPALVHSTRPSVVLAEDDYELRCLLTTVLQREGYCVTALPDGHALERYLEVEPTGLPRPKIIVSDVRMPGAAGLELISRARARHESVPIVLITAFPEEALVFEAKARGATAVLSKPFDIDDFRDLVRRLAGPAGASHEQRGGRMTLPVDPLE